MYLTYIYILRLLSSIFNNENIFSQHWSENIFSVVNLCPRGMIKEEYGRLPYAMK